MLIININIGSN